MTTKLSLPPSTSSALSRCLCPDCRKKRRQQHLPFGKMVVPDDPTEEAVRALIQRLYCEPKYIEYQDNFGKIKTFVVRVDLHWRDYGWT
jgi:hypothetical protein